jgi:rubrerythrin
VRARAGLDDERDDALARRLLDAAADGPPADAAPWRCRQCGETLGAQFTACWQCGAARDPLAD